VLRLDPPHRPELPQQARDGLLGKCSALLDLGTRDGAARLHDLLAGADVLVHGYRPHALDRFGLTPEALADRHPGLVVVSLSAWGSAGPWGGRRGFDSIVQAACGIAVTESADGERPGAMPCQLLDHGTGYLCAAAVLRALAAQAAHGGTQVRELGLARTAHWLLGHQDSAAAAPALNGAVLNGAVLNGADLNDADLNDADLNGPDPDGADLNDADPDGADPAWLITVDGAEGAVTVVRPPGQLHGQGLAWPSTVTRYGSDTPAWR